MTILASLRVSVIVIGQRRVVIRGVTKVAIGWSSRVLSADVTLRAVYRYMCTGERKSRDVVVKARTVP